MAGRLPTGVLQGLEFNLAEGETRLLEIGRESNDGAADNTEIVK